VGSMKFQWSCLRRFNYLSTLFCMKQTPVELFRSGNKSGARLDKVRTQGAGRDVDTRIDGTGDIWVIANGKGVSTWDALDSRWTGTPWRLPAGTTYSDLLLVWNDVSGHWVWEPVGDMRLSEYEDILACASVQFVRV
jgi:hypothetical protein